MKERPILFNKPMVRALLSGQKTQTRRIVKPQPERSGGVLMWAKGRHNRFGVEGLDIPPGVLALCPFGQPGDRLRVKETFYAWGRWENRYSGQKACDEWHFVDLTESSNRPYRYAATDTVEVVPRCAGVVRWWKRPAIFMPRTASRADLENISVRVERLQDISEPDAKAEGADCLTWNGIEDTAADLIDWPLKEVAAPHRNGYALLWESLNGDGSWAENLWVWVVEFKRVAA